MTHVTHDDVLIAMAFASSIGGLAVLAGLAVFFINGGVIDWAARTVKRVFPADAELRVRRQVFTPRTLVEACSEIARLNSVLTRERLGRIRAERRAAQLQLRVDEFEEQLDG